ncbi:MAG TPA: C40 family peptidase [Chloroflexota bacterium]|nr:C40 family peptidase [Chloroflexota bacterium]
MAYGGPNGVAAGLANAAPSATVPGARSTSSMGVPPVNTGAVGTAAGPAPLLAGSSAAGVSLASTSNASASSSSPSRIIPNLPATPTGARIVNVAQSQVGAHYTWAGTSPATGFDCSGFVYWVFNTIGVPLERTLPEQLNAGRRVRLEELRPGDVLFFADTYTPGLSHNGIYIGDGKFIHAADESTGVVITPLNSAYWEQRLVAAVRIVD